MISIQLIISGKVQGVWFRASAEREAKRLGLVGFVRNEPDGNVYAEVEGAPEVVDEFVAWCHRGPDHARVDSVKKTAQPIRGYTSFSIKR